MQPRINVTVPVLTLLGLDDEPADLEGYGPIDPDTARRLAAHAPSMRRILVHPETGAALSYGREHDGAPADLDHTTAWEHGGRTESAHLAALCRRHHRLKHESGWRVAPERGGVMRWTSPAGQVLRTWPERPFVPVAAGESIPRAILERTNPHRRLRIRRIHVRAGCGGCRRRNRRPRRSERPRHAQLRSRQHLR